MRIDGNIYDFVVASDVVREGMWLEVHLGSDVVMAIFYSDQTRKMTVSCFEEGLPIEIVEHAISSAKLRLPDEGDPSNSN